MTIEELASRLTRENAIHHDVILRMRMAEDVIPPNHPLIHVVEHMINSIKKHQDSSLHALVDQYNDELPS